MPRPCDYASGWNALFNSTRHIRSAQKRFQVITVHQAKGLEFPVVAIWDGKGRWDTRPESGAWRMERDGRGWMIDLSQLTWEEPADLGIRQTERAYLDAERRRVVYVAATRGPRLVRRAKKLATSLARPVSCAAIYLPKHPHI